MRLYKKRLNNSLNTDTKITGFIQCSDCKKETNLDIPIIQTLTKTPNYSTPQFFGQRMNTRVPAKPLKRFSLLIFKSSGTTSFFIFTFAL